MKYLKYIIIFVIILIVVLIIVINNLSSNQNYTNNNISNIVSANNDGNNYISNVNNTVLNETPKDKKMEINGNIQELTSVNMFFAIENSIQSYIDNITNMNNLAVYNQLDSNYINTNNITTSNVLDFMSIFANQEFRALKINYVVGEKYNQYSVYGKLLSDKKNTSEVYFIINVDMDNFCYSIIPQLESKYSDLSQVNISITNRNIINSENNQMKYSKITDEQLIKSIINDYQKNALYDTQNAYKSLNTEYSKARFKDYSDYFNYVKNNVSKIQDLNLVSYNKSVKSEYTQYICKDIYENIYTVNATGIMEYKIILDDYTIQNTSEYINLTNEAKVKFNVNKIIKMLNTCDYTHLYNVLNNNFKANYFNTQTEFETYIKQNFYEYNIISSIEVTESENDDIYICVVELKDRVAIAANTMTKTIIMKLGTGTNFEMSFDV